jgi:hypothetical protein
MSHLYALSQETRRIFLQIYSDFLVRNIDLVYLSDYPQRAETWVEGHHAFWQNSASRPKFLLYGGRPTENPFPQDAVQQGFDGSFDDFSKENMRAISELIAEEKIAIASYEQCAELEWLDVLPNIEISAQ